MEQVEKPVFFTIKKELAQQIASGEKTHEGRPVDARGVSDVLVGSKVAFHYYRPERLICKVSEVEEFETVHDMVAAYGNGLLPKVSESSRVAIWLCKGIDFYFEGLEVLMRSPVNHKTLCFNLLQTFTGPIPRAWI